MYNFKYNVYLILNLDNYYLHLLSLEILINDFLYFRLFNKCLSRFKYI